MKLYYEKDPKYEKEPNDKKEEKNRLKAKEAREFEFSLLDDFLQQSFHQLPSGLSGDHFMRPGCLVGAYFMAYYSVCDANQLSDI
jgi:hypothetical protein